VEGRGGEKEEEEKACRFDYRLRGSLGNRRSSRKGKKRVMAIRPRRFFEILLQKHKGKKKGKKDIKCRKGKSL